MSFNGFEISNSTIVGHKILFEMPLWGAVDFSKLEAHDNWLDSGETSIFKFKYTTRNDLVFKNLQASGNYLKDGTVIQFE